MDTRDVRLSETCLFEAVYALGVGLFGAECTYIKTVARKCVLSAGSSIFGSCVSATNAV